MKNFIYQQSANYFKMWAFVYVLRNRKKMEFGKELFTELASKVEAFCVKKYGQNLCNCLKNQNKLKTRTGFYPTL